MDNSNNLATLLCWITAFLSIYQQPQWPKPNHTSCWRRAIVVITMGTARFGLERERERQRANKKMATKSWLGGPHTHETHGLYVPTRSYFHDHLVEGGRYARCVQKKLKNRSVTRGRGYQELHLAWSDHTTPRSCLDFNYHILRPAGLRDWSTCGPGPAARKLRSFGGSLIVTTAPPTKTNTDGDEST